MSFFSLPSPIQQLKSSFIEKNGLEVFVKRDDLIHPVVSGNKWRKLKYNVELAKSKKHTCLLTFGGAFSNHLIATAETGRLFGFRRIGIVRGDEPKDYAYTLLKCKEAGMELYFISRGEYRQKTDPEFLEKLRDKFGNFYLVPEGGANDMGVKGCEEILSEDSLKFDYIACAAGTATTASGILRTLGEEKLIVVPVLKGGSSLIKQIQQFVEKEQMNKMILFENYHFGGYAKIDHRLIDFANQFYQTYQIQLDLVYTAKLFYAIFQTIEQAYFAKRTRILLLHTGGLQGNRGLENRYGFSLDYC